MTYRVRVIVAGKAVQSPFEDLEVGKERQIRGRNWVRPAGRRFKQRIVGTTMVMVFDWPFFDRYAFVVDIFQYAHGDASP